MVDEIALYDRQIRLWGMGTQLRLRSARVLIVNIGSIGLEIVKNLVLGGINSIELLDDSVIKPEDYGAQFFLPKDSDDKVGELKLPHIIESIQELNNRVELNINTESFESLLNNQAEFFKKFDLIVGTELTRVQITALNTLTRNFKSPLYTTGSHGMFGYVITDLINHITSSEKDIGNQPRKPDTPLNLHKIITEVKYNPSTNKEILTINDKYLPIDEIFHSKLLADQLTRRQLKRLTPALPIIMTLFHLPHELITFTVQEFKPSVIQTCIDLGINPDIITDEYLQHFIDQGFTEFSPTSAILGGCVAQDIIQYLSKMESPINNVLILDGIRSEMPIFTL